MGFVLAKTPTSGNNIDTFGENNSTIKDSKMLVCILLVLITVFYLIRTSLRDSGQGLLELIVASSHADLAIFKEKRAEQVVAAESILKLADYSKQYKMVKIVLEKLFKVTNVPIYKCCFCHKFLSEGSSIRQIT